KFDFTKTPVSLKQGARTIIAKTGGHPTGNPAIPAVVLANLRRGTTALKAGTLVVTGSFTGFHPVELNEPVVGEFDGFVTMEATIVSERSTKTSRPSRSDRRPTTAPAGSSRR